MYTKPFSEISSDNVDQAGGKGASLGEMTGAGIQVPPGFVILSSAFEKMLEENSLRDDIDAALHAVDRDVVHTVDDASEKIRGIIESVEIPKEIEEEILSAFENLNAEFVAVRSSATSEDSADAAWAGQLETYLNTTKEDLLDHVRKCWGSLFTPRAIFYRFEQGLHGKPISVAVVVQKMVNSEISGIAFSVHPVTQDYNQLIIEAGYGLGEAIVSGQVTPDSYVMEKDSNTIIETTVQTQSKKLVRGANGGNEWEDLPEDIGSSQILSGDQVVKLGDMIKNIEKHYGFPVDVEWAFENGEFYITQSRPITTLTNVDSSNKKEDPPFPQEELFKWGPVPGFYFYLSEFLPPLYKAAEERYQAAWPKMILIFQKDIMFCGLSQREVDEAAVEVFERLLLPEKTYEKLFDEYKTSLVALQAIQKEIDDMDLSELAKDAFVDLWHKYYDRVLDFWVPTGPMELGNFSSSKALEHKLADYILDADERRQAMEVLTAPEGMSFYQKEEIELAKTDDLDAHTAKYYWLKNSYAGVQRLSRAFFEDRKAELAIDAEAKELVRLEKVKERKQAIVEKYALPTSIVDYARAIARAIAWQDDRKEYIFRGLEYKARLLEEVARRSGYKYDDLLNIGYDEAVRAIEGVDLTELIEIRKKGFAMEVQFETEYFDDELAEKYWYMYAQEQVEGDIKEFSGTTASKGDGKVVRGKVKIMFRPHQSYFDKGNILVAPMTSPEYVFAMKQASAIITDTGGLTSHAAIVSREMGKPCIVGTKIATSVLKDGMAVEVDAEKGIVKIIE